MDLLKRNLSNQTKELMLSVISDNSLLVPIMHQLSHYRDRDKLMRWLVMNGIIGQNLVQWLKIYFDNSVMGMVKFIVRHHEKNRDIKPIILNKDWIK